MSLMNLKNFPGNENCKNGRFQDLVSFRTLKAQVDGNMLVAIAHFQSYIDYTVLPVLRDHSREVIKVVSYSRWCLNAGSIALI